MSTTTVIACVSLAVAAAFLHPAIISVVEEVRSRRKREELAEAKKELEDEIRNGHNLARISSLSHRVRQLEDDLGWR